MPPAPLRDTFAQYQNSRFDVCGFVLDDQDYVHLLLAQTATTEQIAHRKVTERTYKTLSLFEMDLLGRHFRSQFRSDGEIFSAAPDAVAREKSLGYVCYQMRRRLLRVDAMRSVYDKVDYSASLNLQDMSDAIRQVIKGNIDKDGRIKDALFETLRAHDFPIAIAHEAKERTKLSPFLMTVPLTPTH
jgi:hypothetical protein